MRDVIFNSPFTWFQLFGMRETSNAARQVFVVLLYISKSEHGPKSYAKGMSRYSFGKFC